MATAMKWYGNAIKAAFNKEIDFNDGNVKVALVTSSYTPDQDTHDYFDDITHEVTSDNYVAGGAALDSPTVTYTAGSNLTTFDAADTTWTTVTFTARYCIVYYSTGVAGTSPLICWGDFDGDKSPSAGNFTITWNGSGLITATVS